MDFRKILLNSGVKNLNEFGYPHCTTENILTDAIYREFFKGMLESNKGQHAKADLAIAELLQEIEANNKAEV
jgi:hypothetical protein